MVEVQEHILEGARGGMFAGLKVADFSWAAAGPITTRFLADYGATVVRVESGVHMDSVRFGGPFRDGVPNTNKSGFFAEFNAGKLGITLNMRSDEGRALARRLVEWADVVTESFAPGVMDKWGLGWADIHELNPSAVMVSSSLRGAGGPQSNYRGYGGQGAALSGLHLVTGWPDRNPAGPKGAYTDSIAPRYAMAALMAALIERRRSGRGQYVEISQVETALQFLTTELLDYQINRTVAGPIGNRSPRDAPHAAYPCLGEDRWIAISVESDEEWVALADVVGLSWSADEGLRRTTTRLERVEEVDTALAAWTSGWDAYELMHLLQSRGVRAGVVQKPSDLFDDPQLALRGHFVELDGGEMGRVGYNRSPYLMERTPSEPRRGAPDLGEHTDQVLREILGIDDDSIAAMREAEALL